MKITLLATVAFLFSACAWGGNPDWPNLEEVIIATKCHLDVGYTATVPELMRKYSTTDLDNAFALFDSDKDKPADLRARWTVPAWAMDVMLERASPGRRSRLEESIRQHRLMWHAFPFTIETEASDLEELVRMFAFSSGISRHCGFDLPRYVKQTDVPDQAWALPTVLAHAGVKFLHMGINPGCKQKEFLDKLPVLSWWEGPDGSRVLLGFSSGYGWMGWGSLTPPKGWRHKTWLAYMMRSDNKGPISPKDAEKILERAKAELPGVKVRYGDPAEFADAILAEEGANPTLPVVRGDMPDTWIHGQMTAPEATLLHRHAKSDLITLGILDTSLRAFAVKTDPVAGELEQGYRQSCLYSEHTWGFSCYRDRKRFQDPDWRERYDRGEFKHIDDSFDYHMKYARRAYAIAQDGIKKRMEALARSVDAEGPRVVVFNPLPYARDAVVEVEMPKGYSLPGGVREGCKVKFLAKGLPAGGYKTFPVEKGKCYQCENVAGSNVASSQSHQSNQLALETVIGTIPTSATLHARHFTVKFDFEKGGISSLVENATGRELVKQGGHVLGQFLHERFSQNEVLRFVGAYNRAHQRNINSDFGKAGLPPPDKVPYTALTPKNWTAKHVHTALGDEVTLTAGDTLGLAKDYEIRFFFPDHAACVDISWKVTEKTPDPRPEGGWICLPFNVAAPSFRVGRIGGTIDPAKDIIFGANRNLMCVDRAITVRNGAAGAGVGVASADLPLWSLGKPGLWRYEPDYVPAEPEVFANLYNNQWNTNFPFWIPGSWTASLRVYPVSEGADEETAVFTPAWEIRQPCVAAFAEGSRKNIHVEQVEHVKNLNDLHVLHGQNNKGGLAVSRKGVRVTAFCPNPDGAGTVLRVWEQAGKAGEITVTLPKGLKAASAQPVNLRGEPTGEPIAIKDGTFSFVLGAWAPKSFVLSGGLADVTAVESYRFYRFAVDKTLAYSRRLDVPRTLPEDAVVYPLATGDGRCLVSYKVNGTTLHELAPVKDSR